MRNRFSLAGFLILAFVSVGSLGATQCGDDLLHGLVARLADHEERITALEDCDCEGVLAPVCGENGKTYVNLCEARCAGTEVASAGRCHEPVCGGPEGVACGEGQFCETTPSCRPQAAGFCEEIPEICTREYLPVCGCDGRTYANDCERRAAGVSLAFPGACEDEPTGCQTNDECEATEYCRKAEGVCGAERGACTPRPELCTLDYAPVCGCDGKTYSNACAAALSGVSVEHDEACAEPPVACDDNADCGAREFCKKRVGACGGEGVCLPRPDVCPLYVGEVCGCDGRTYSNECAASAAGVSLAGGDACYERKVTLCHVPPGNPANRQTISVGESAVPAHLRHGDTRGECPPH